MLKFLALFDAEPPVAPISAEVPKTTSEVLPSSNSNDQPVMEASPRVVQQAIADSQAMRVHNRSSDSRREPKRANFERSNYSLDSAPTKKNDSSPEKKPEDTKPIIPTEAPQPSFTVKKIEKARSPRARIVSKDEPKSRVPLVQSERALSGGERKTVPKDESKTRIPLAQTERALSGGERKEVSISPREVTPRTRTSMFNTQPRGQPPAERVESPSPITRSLSNENESSSTDTTLPKQKPTPALLDSIFQTLASEGAFLSFPQQPEPPTNSRSRLASAETINPPPPRSFGLDSTDNLINFPSVPTLPQVAHSKPNPEIHVDCTSDDDTSTPLSEMTNVSTQPPRTTSRGLSSNELTTNTEQAKDCVPSLGRLSGYLNSSRKATEENEPSPPVQPTPDPPSPRPTARLAVRPPIMIRRTSTVVEVTPTTPEGVQVLPPNSAVNVSTTLQPRFQELNTEQGEHNDEVDDWWNTEVDSTEKPLKTGEDLEREAKLEAQARADARAANIALIKAAAQARARADLEAKLQLLAQNRQNRPPLARSTTSNPSTQYKIDSMAQANFAPTPIPEPKIDPPTSQEALQALAQAKFQQQRLPPSTNSNPGFSSLPGRHYGNVAQTPKQRSLLSNFEWAPPSSPTTDSS